MTRRALALLTAALVAVSFVALPAAKAHAEVGQVRFNELNIPANVGGDHRLPFAGRSVAVDADRVERPASGVHVTLRRGRSGLPDPTIVKTAFTRVSAAFSPAPKVVGETVNIVGTLERQTSPGVWAPFGKAALRVSGSGLPEAGKIVTTGADGTYSIPVTVHWEPSWQVTYEPTGSDHHWSTMTLPRKSLLLMYRTVVEGVNAGPEPATSGGTVTMAGRVVRQVPGGTQPVGKAWVVPQFAADGKTWRNATDYTVADAKGGFKVVVKTTAAGHWRIAYDGDAYNLPSKSAADHVAIKYRTGFSSFNASPEPVKKGRTLTVSGKLNRDVNGWKAAGAGAAINVYFKPAGSSKWSLLTVVKTDSKGLFRKGFKASKDGTWLATYKGGTTYLGSSSPGDYVDVR